MAKSTFEHVLLAHLEVGVSEPYVLPDAALPILARTLTRVMASSRAEAEVQRALQLVTAFEKQLGAPALASTLVELLRADPHARALSRKFGPRSKLDVARSFRRREGRAEPLRAPVIDTPAPTTAVRLSQLVARTPSRSVGGVNGVGLTPAVARELRVRRG